MQKQERHHAALETEHRSMKQAIGAACFAFDDSLLNLQQQRDESESALCMIQLQQAAITASHERQLHLQLELEKATQQLSKLSLELAGKQQMVNGVIQALTK